MENLRNILSTKAYNCFYNEKKWMLFNSDCELFLDGEKLFECYLFVPLLFWLVLSIFFDLSKTNNAYCRRGAHQSFD